MDKATGIQVESHTRPAWQRVEQAHAAWVKRREECVAAADHLADVMLNRDMDSLEGATVATEVARTLLMRAALVLAEFYDDAVTADAIAPALVAS